MSRILRILAVLAALPCAATGHADPSYPNKPVRIVVGYQAGGPTDIVARLLAAKLQVALGQAFVVDNRAGAGSNIASETVAAAPPDGYTLLVAAAPMTMNGWIYKNLRYDAEKSFAPISRISSAPGVLAVRTSLPVTSVAELVALAKARSGELTYGTTGIGGTQHMATEHLQQLTGTRLLHVPYKGGSGALADLIAGHVDLAFMTSTGAMSTLEAGKVRPLAVAGSKRLSAIPNVPTFAEIGLPDMLSDSWNGLLAPAGTPPEIVRMLHEAVAKAVQAPDLRAKLESQGAQLVGNSPEEFRQEIGKEVRHWKAQFSRIKIETN